MIDTDTYTDVIDMNEINPTEDREGISPEGSCISVQDEPSLLCRSLTQPDLLEYTKSVRFRKHVQILYIPSSEESIEQSVEYTAEDNAEIEVEQRHPHHHHHHHHHYHHRRHHRHHHHHRHPSSTPLPQESTPIPIIDPNTTTITSHNIGFWWCMSIDPDIDSPNIQPEYRRGIPYMCIVS